MNREMIMSILSGLEGALDDSIMEDVAKKRPEACITIKIVGPKGAEIGGEEPGKLEDDGPDELDARFAAVSRGRNSFDKERGK